VGVRWLGNVYEPPETAFEAVGVRIVQVVLRAIDILAREPVPLHDARTTVAFDFDVKRLHTSVEAPPAEGERYAVAYLKILREASFEMHFQAGTIDIYPAASGGERSRRHSRIP
jgi:hypothetical protein